MNNLYCRRLISIIFFFIFLSYHNQLFAQITTVGKEFWVGFMENNRIGGQIDTGIILITANEESEGFIQYNNKQVPFKIKIGEQFFHRITDFDIIHRLSGQIEDKGVYIESSGNITVHAFNDRRRSSDGTVVLPIPTLGKDYYITSHFELGPETATFNPNINNESTLLIVAVEDDTDIEITPKVNALGKPKDIAFVIQLNKGQSYQLKAREDLTGSRVRVVGSDSNECKRIAVFGGNKNSSVGQCSGGNSHLFQQAYSVNTWGNDFLHVSFGGRNSGETVKILASEDSTELFIDGNFEGVINAGEFVKLDFGHDQIASIKSSKPVSVTSFSKGVDCNQPGSLRIGDPFMITYNSNQQLLYKTSFNSLSLTDIPPNGHFITIITKRDARIKTILDGKNIGPQFKVFQEYAYAKIRLNEGLHTLENPDGFIAYTYGFGNFQSYGYALGSQIENLYFEIVSDFELNGEVIACLNQPAAWEINPGNQLFQFFSWDFGDGSPVSEGKVVNHKFEKPGAYEILVTASVGQDNCDYQEEVRFEILVAEFSGEIIGATSVCPVIEEINYVFKSNVQLAKVDWEVEGGEIIDSKENEITVRWGETNLNAKVSAIPYSMQGCPGEKIEILVVVNNQITPKLPIGKEKICFDKNIIYEYTVAESLLGRGYEWFIEGGIINGSSDESKVEVIWPDPQTIGYIWYKEFSLISDDCEGMSPKLQVDINSIFSAEVFDKEMVVCFGSDTGKIEVRVTGGSAPYNFAWSHDQTINFPIIEGLQAGVYSVIITDDFGCEIRLDDIIIDQLSLLSIETNQTEGTTCFGKADGEAVLNVVGGTAPYDINLPSKQINGNQINLFDLEGREYDLEITDFYGCVLPVNFKVDSPLPLDVDVRIVKYACPGESNGELSAASKGGNGPYNFTWDLDGSTQNMLYNVPRGKYLVKVIDNQGCLSIGTGNMIEANPVVRMPTGYNPREGLFEGVGNCPFTFILIIYNRWGELIHFGENGWDGKINKKDAPIGNYTYVLSYSYSLNGEPESDQIKGGFTLVR